MHPAWLTMESFPCRSLHYSVFLADIRYNFAMFAFRKPSSLKGLAVWQILFCLTVLSFVLRSTIPSGYMPDSSASRNGTIALTLCSAGGGNATILLDLQGKTKHSSSDEHNAGQHCAFGVVASQGVLPTSVSILPAMTVLSQPLPARQRNLALPPMPAQGPPLGSRAPPSHLG